MEQENILKIKNKLKNILKEKIKNILFLKKKM